VQATRGGRTGASTPPRRASGWRRASTCAFSPKPPMTCAAPQSLRTGCCRAGAAAPDERAPAAQALARAFPRCGGRAATVQLRRLAGTAGARRRAGRKLRVAPSGRTHIVPVRQPRALQQRQHGAAVVADHLARPERARGKQALSCALNQAGPDLQARPLRSVGALGDHGAAIGASAQRCRARGAAAAPGVRRCAAPHVAVLRCAKAAGGHPPVSALPTCPRAPAGASPRLCLFPS
jgi:hypothetical protein